MMTFLFDFYYVAVHELQSCEFPTPTTFCPFYSINPRTSIKVFGITKHCSKHGYFTNILMCAKP